MSTHIYKSDEIHEDSGYHELAAKAASQSQFQLFRLIIKPKREKEKFTPEDWLFKI